MQTLEAKGNWWVPDAPDHQIGGYLKFAPETGGELELLGLLPDLAESANPTLIAPEAIPVIHGMGTDGKRISLLQCMLSSASTNIGTGAAISSYRAVFVIRGQHVTAPFQELRVTRLLISFDHLADWYGPTAIRREFTGGSGSEGTGRGMTVSFSADFSETMPRDPVVPLSFGEMRLATSIQSQFDRIDRASLTQEVFFVSEFSEPMAFERVLSHVVYHLQNFLTLGVGAPIAITKLSMAFASDTQEPGDEADARQTPSEVFQETTRAEAVRSGRGRIHRHRMVFGFDDVRAQWPVILTRLFDSGELLRSVYDLYFATVYGPRLYLQNRFLNFAQAAETLHRTLFGPSPLLGSSAFDDLRNRLNAVIQDPALQVPSEIRSEFKRRVSYWNQASLRRRVRDLVVLDEPTLQAGVTALVGEPRDFCQSVVGARNYLTHYDPNDAHHVPSMGALLRLTEKVACVLRLHLMRDLGIPSPIIGRHVQVCAVDASRIRSIWESDS